jgi:hypothetical protein
MPQSISTLAVSIEGEARCHGHAVSYLDIEGSSRRKHLSRVAILEIRELKAVVWQSLCGNLIEIPYHSRWQLSSPPFTKFHAKQWKDT